MSPPEAIATERLLLRRWSVADAPRFLAALVDNAAHPSPWLAPWLARPAPLEELEERLSAWAADFDAGRQWVYAVLPAGGEQVIGGVGLYPRADRGRASLTEADHLEIGYWVRAGATGHGYATEAARGLLAAAAGVERMQRMVLRCDPGNHASIAIARRLGFTHEATVWEDHDAPGLPPAPSMIWARDIGIDAPGR